MISPECGKVIPESDKIVARQCVSRGADSVIMSDCDLEPFFFMKLELDAGGGGGGRGGGCDVRMYGKSSGGRTVAVRLQNYRPHFYVSFDTRDRFRLVATRLIELIRRESVPVVQFRSAEPGRYSALINDRTHSAYDPAAYHDARLRHLAEVRVKTFYDIGAVVKIILDIVTRRLKDDGAYSLDEVGRCVHFYESNIDARVRVANRLGVRPCQWCFFHRNRFAATVLGPVTVYTHVCTDDGPDIGGGLLFQTENAPPPPPLPPPVSVMSFDIECLAEDLGVFPTPDRCPVIQISCVTAPDSLGRHEYNGGAAIDRRVYVLGACDPVEGARVLSFDSEREMLQSFVRGVRELDPDIITGYNIVSFDFPFLFERLRVLNADRTLGRCGRASSCKKNARAAADKCYGSHVPITHYVEIEGRTLFDTMVYVKREFKGLRSYTLNAVSQYFLKDRKDDVHYSYIPRLYAQGAAGRAKIAKYCVKDSQLVLDLVFHLQAFLHMNERSKVFNTTLQYMADRGQQIKIVSMLLDYCSSRRILINDVITAEKVVFGRVRGTMNDTLDTIAYGGGAPACKRHRAADDTEGAEEDEEEEEEEEEERPKRTVNFTGAIVIEPKRGLYHEPVICLDFASLYPSIMIAYNLCYTTLIINETDGARLVDEGLAHRTANGHYFFNAEVKRGVLPTVLSVLMENRADVRRRMLSVDRDSIVHRMLDGQQSALKIAANSIYGWTGFQRGQLFYLQIPSSVTSYGREMITRTKDYVETHYERLRVIYGDTDSVMIHVTDWDAATNRLWECYRTGTEIAARVTAAIGRPPISLEFETVYMPYMLSSKKKYAAGKYTDLARYAANPSGPPPAPVFKCSGLEVVRRDNCLLVKKSLTRVLDMVIGMKTADELLRQMKRDMDDLWHGRVDLIDLVITKEWKKRTAAAQPHDTLARKMAERNPGDAPQPGDRVPYIVVAAEGLPISERAEDPLRVLELGLPVDYAYYAEKQLLNPLSNVLAIAMPHMDREDIKDALWPDPYSERPAKRYPRGHKRPCSSKAAKEMKSYFVSVAADYNRAFANEPGVMSADIEDLCSSLAATCLECKSRDRQAVASCKNRECGTLYKRYSLRYSNAKAIANVDRGSAAAEACETLGFIE